MRGELIWWQIEARNRETVGCGPRRRGASSSDCSSSKGSSRVVIVEFMPEWTRKVDWSGVSCQLLEAEGSEGCCRKAQVREVRLANI